ncbi:MAG: hypothetical protein CYPHOPRED_000775 [Cyphobasidiales sp. Tagirdzhanova-0007]|nr:MAG: hypothetical protein CYPHOPRED_000775 [Cyphobasidiales sp. Tagirdzhanova-0007]
MSYSRSKGKWALYGYAQTEGSLWYMPISPLYLQRFILLPSSQAPLMNCPGATSLFWMLSVRRRILSRFNTFFHRTEHYRKRSLVTFASITHFSFFPLDLLSHYGIRGSNRKLLTVAAIASASGSLFSVLFVCLYTHIQRNRRRKQSAFLLDRWLAGAAKGRPTISNPIFLETEYRLAHTQDASKNCTSSPLEEKTPNISTSLLSASPDTSRALPLLPLRFPGKPDYLAVQTQAFSASRLVPTVKGHTEKPLLLTAQSPILGHPGVFRPFSNIEAYVSTATSKVAAFSKSGSPLTSDLIAWPQACHIPQMIFASDNSARFDETADFRSSMYRATPSETGNMLF